MQTQTQLEHDRIVEQKVQKVKELYADAPELGRVALEKGLPDLTREMRIIAARRGADLVSVAQRTGGWQRRGTLADGSPKGAPASV